MVKFVEGTLIPLRDLLLIRQGRQER